eukprot:g1117.t1
MAILFDLYIRDKVRVCRRPKKIGGEGSGQSNGRLRIIISFTQQISILLMFPAKWPEDMLKFKEIISIWMVDRYERETDTIAVMLGVLHSIYKPGVFKYFEVRI